MHIMQKPITGVLLLALAACAASDRSSASASPPPAADATSALEPATLPAPKGSVLRVWVEPGRVVGWVAGSATFEGVSASLGVGDRMLVAPVGADNTFVIPIDTPKRVEATVRVGDLAHPVSIEPIEKAAAAALVIADRPAYRPGQKLAFAAFLRTLDHAIVANTKVEARIVSDTKQTTAAKLALTSDANGKLIGEYTFSPQDPLDTYTISIPGFVGSARVTLSEFRKSKIKLAVDAALTGRHAELTFRALDFLDKPVPGGTVSFTAQVVDDPIGERDTSDAFAGGPPVRSFSREDALQFASGAEIVPSGVFRRVASETKGTLELDAKGFASHKIPVRSELVRGRHRMLVDAVIVDANGHEQRTTRSMPLVRTGARIEVAAAGLVGAGAPIEVAVKVLDDAGQVVTPESASIAAVRIAPPASYYGGLFADNGNVWYGNGWNGNDGLDNNIVTIVPPNGGSFRLRTGRFRPQPARQPADVLAATVAVVNDRARFELDDPGAYRLVASARLADGSTVWHEVGVAVREFDSGPPLLVTLHRDEVREGERITGTVRGSYRDAPVLVVVRDARGIRARHRLTLDGGSARIDLPTVGIGYGATVEAYMMGAGQKVQAAQQLVRIDQVDKRLGITTTANPTYGPGEVVDLGIAVDRAEQLDLVVSVFDQSILSVAPDRAADPHAFLHADARLHSRAALHALRAELGAVTVGAIAERARARVKRVGDPDHGDATLVVQSVDHGTVATAQFLTALLRQAGISAAFAPPYGGGSITLAVGSRKELLATRVIDLVERMPQLALRRISDVTVIYDPAQLAAAPTSQLDVADYYVGGNAVHSVAPIRTFAQPVAMDVGDSTGDAVRRDFSDSAFWSATTRTGSDGKAHVRFKLPDSITNWQIVVTAVGRDARVGRHVTRLRTVRDVMIWPILPRQFTEGDTISVFGTVHNLGGAEREMAVSLEATGLELLSPKLVTIRVPANSNVPVTWSVRVKEGEQASLLMTTTGGGLTDASLKRVPIVSSSAEQVLTASGFADRPLTLALPAGVDPKHAHVELTFAPSLAADMIQTLDYLVEYPYGCAEQTMSRFAPAIRVAGILDRMGIEDSALAKRLPSVVDGGMKRLAQLQQPDGGWGWTGTASTHEMITPYVVWGLLEAQKAGHRAADLVLERGLARVHSLFEGTAAHSDRTYLAYVYSQQHRISDRWWSSITAHALEGSDYALALALEMAVARKDTAHADRFATELRSRAKRTHGGVNWTTAGFSRWSDDPYEVTAVVLKAFAAYDHSDRIIPDIVAHFVATKRGDRWNSTKDTAMVLYAMSDLLAKQGGNGKRGASVDYTIGHGKATRLEFPDGRAHTVEVPGDQVATSTTFRFKHATPGMMVRAVLRYRRVGRDLAAANHGLGVTRKLYQLGAKGARIRELASGDRVPRGAYVESVVSVQSGRHDLRFLLIEDPKPAGAEAMPLDDPRFVKPTLPGGWVLREDRETHLAFHFETARESTQVSSILHLELAGDLVIPPAQSELMYETQTRGHSGSFVLKVD
ncbi:MAG: alpha-2-macroglobulin family protein [Kofleriaceae bacterium]